jgi:hypothetical protein
MIYHLNLFTSSPSPFSKWAKQPKNRPTGRPFPHSPASLSPSDPHSGPSLNSITQTLPTKGWPIAAGGGDGGQPGGLRAPGRQAAAVDGWAGFDLAWGGQVAAGRRRAPEPRRRGEPHPRGDKSGPAGRPAAVRHGRTVTTAPQQAGRGGARGAGAGASAQGAMAVAGSP